MTRALALVDSHDESRKYDQAITPSGLLETKLYAPRTRFGLVPRPRLTEGVRQGAENKLTIVVAPAGFGKTTLLSDCLAGARREGTYAAWVSLDAGENEHALFWAYVIGALRKVCPDIGTHALSLLRSPHPAAIEAVLTTLINDIEATDADFILVLDDYHVIDAAPVHTALNFLLDHLPARMHVVIASRSEPQLALSRFRARGELTELRVGDMRFTTEEASAFLNTVMHLELSEADAATLERRTEGWIAGIKLAALSLKKGADVRAFVESFSGDNRYIADYLVDEVLQSEPDEVRRFLLTTAILDRMSGDLCDAVTGGRDSQRLLEDLERRNLFVVALDDRREWFRYHHLFAEVLQTQALRADRERLRLSHGRASAWYEQHGAPGNSVRHALEAGDAERAARVLEMVWPQKDRSYEAKLWLDRVKMLPDDVVRARPVLSMGYAWALLNSGELEAAEPRLRDVERALADNALAGSPPTASSHAAASASAPSSTQLIVDDKERLRTLATELASARVYLTQALGDVLGTLEHARRALDLVPENDHAARATATALLALAFWGRGELETAHRTFSEALAAMRTAGQELDAIRGIFVLGDIRAAQGRLRDAVDTYESGLRAANARAFATPPETDELFFGLGEIHREWNDLESAARHLEVVAQSAGRGVHKSTRRRWGAAMARIAEARGDFGGALALLDEAEQHERRDPLPRVRPIPALKARIDIARGKLEDAADWAAKAKLSVDDDLSYVREYEHITLARMLLARAGSTSGNPSLHDAARMLERLSAAAETGGRVGSVIEILVLQSMALHALGNARAALDSLARALALGEPEGYVRVFLDEGTRVRDLMRTAVARGLTGEYGRRVLAAFDAPGFAAAGADAKKPGASGIPTSSGIDSAKPGATRPDAGSSVQSLTARELEILRLIAAGLRNQAIADHLAISAATVKRHIANAYGKLGAGHRTEALARAKELKLL